MKINLIAAAIIVAIIYFAPSFFLPISGVVIAIAGMVALFAVFTCRDELIANFKAQRQKKRDAAYRQQLSVQLATAQHALDAGDEKPMRMLAETLSVADAWCALAAAYQIAPEGTRDEAAITHAYKQACESPWRIENLSCELDYERRYFHGIGVCTDYLKLIEDWGSGYRGGERHEVDLAWIFTFGPDKLRNYETAWQWLSLGKARSSSLHSDLLAPEVMQEVQAMAMSKVPERVRARIEADAKDEAYREFVAGK